MAKRKSSRRKRGTTRRFRRSGRRARRNVAVATANRPPRRYRRRRAKARRRGRTNAPWGVRPVNVSGYRKGAAKGAAAHAVRRYSRKKSRKRARKNLPALAGANPARRAIRRYRRNPPLVARGKVAGFQGALRELRRSLPDVLVVGATAGAAAFVPELVDRFAPAALKNRRGVGANGRRSFVWYHGANAGIGLGLTALVGGVSRSRRILLGGAIGTLSRVLGDLLYEYVPLGRAAPPSSVTVSTAAARGAGNDPYRAMLEHKTGAARGAAQGMSTVFGQPQGNAWSNYTGRKV